jgi:hypothetical protein
MKEYVLIEFCTDMSNHIAVINYLNSLDKSDFHPTRHESEYDIEWKKWIVISGRISTEAATLIKLQNPLIAECMRISYISDELKDKYRK